MVNTEDSYDLRQDLRSQLNEFLQKFHLYSKEPHGLSEEQGRDKKPIESIKGI